jgi:hypothetical protein
LTVRKDEVRIIAVFTVFQLLTDFVCLYNYEFGLSLCKIVRSSVILLLPLFVKDKKIHEARAFKFTYRYIDDVLSIDNSRFAEFL